MAEVESDLSDLEDLIWEGFEMLGDRHGHISYDPFLRGQGELLNEKELYEFLNETADF